MGKHHRENLYSDYAFIPNGDNTWWRVPNMYVNQMVEMHEGLIVTPAGVRTIDEQGRIYDATR
jgi:hypothetical protein